jgi:hypothetical protein
MFIPRSWSVTVGPRLDWSTVMEVVAAAAVTVTGEEVQAAVR